jgi:hypothetical protein
MKKVLLSLAVILSVFACQETKKAETKKAVKETIQKEVSKLWQANPETTTGIKAMKKLITDFKPTENNDAYVALKNSLVDEFNGILTNCTMNGEAHEHLHDYLVPMKGMVDEISSKNSIEENQKVVNAYKKYLEKYATIFK